MVWCYSDGFSCSAELASPCGWMLVCITVQASPVPPSTTHLSPQRKTLLYKTSRSGLCSIELRNLKRWDTFEGCPTVLQKQQNIRTPKSTCGVATSVQNLMEQLPLHHPCTWLRLAHTQYDAWSSGSQTGHSVYTGLICACYREVTRWNPVIQGLVALSERLFASSPVLNPLGKWDLKL